MFSFFFIGAVITRAAGAPASGQKNRITVYHSLFLQVYIL